LEASGPGGKAKGSAHLSVFDKPVPTATPEPLPTPAPEPPVIEDFSADRLQIEAGECVYLSWSVGGWVHAWRIAYAWNCQW
jgi:hypothetical protein